MAKRWKEYAALAHNAARPQSQHAELRPCRISTSFPFPVSPSLHRRNDLSNCFTYEISLSGQSSAKRNPCSAARSSSSAMPLPVLCRLLAKFSQLTLPDRSNSKCPSDRLEAVHVVLSFSRYRWQFDNATLNSLSKSS
jgi:hypothetical protein